MGRQSEAASSASDAQQRLRSGRDLSVGIQDPEIDTKDICIVQSVI